MKDSSYIDFSAPEGFTLPEGIQEGEDFDSVATFTLKPGGTMCLKNVAGLPVSKAPQLTEKTTGQRMMDAYKGENVEGEPEY